MHVLYRQMGAVKRVVVKVQEIVSTAKTFEWKEFKAYRGGVLLVRSTRLHKVARTHDAHGHARGPCCDREENWGKERERSPTGLKAPEKSASWALWCAVLHRLPQLRTDLQSSTLTTPFAPPCAPQVIARAIFELKYLVSFAIATIAVANNTRKAADEAHCRMAMQAANTAPATSLRVFGQLLKVGANKLSSGADDAASNMDITYCLAEKEARLTHGWDLNDWKADCPLFVLIVLVVATHIVAFVLILRQAIKEKPVAGCHSNMKS
jgi:hypothetical protein